MGTHERVLLYLLSINIKTGTRLHVRTVARIFQVRGFAELVVRFPCTREISSSYVYPLKCIVENSPQGAI